VRLEVLVFNGNHSLAQDRREIVVVDYDSSLESERAEWPPLLVVEFRRSGGAVTLKIMNLGQVHRINQRQAGERTGDRGQREENCKGKAPRKFALIRFRRAVPT
jgi:hypothetical protein